MDTYTVVLMLCIYVAVMMVCCLLFLWSPLSAVALFLSLSPPPPTLSHLILKKLVDKVEPPVLRLARWGRHEDGRLFLQHAASSLSVRNQGHEILFSLHAQHFWHVTAAVLLLCKRGNTVLKCPSCAI